MRKTNNRTCYRQELKDKILTVAMKEFKQKGIRSVKMDDIANLLSISKRTMYEIYADKEHLLLEGVCRNEKYKTERVEKFSNDPHHNVMDIIMEVYHLQMEDLAKTNPLFFAELKRYPKVMSYLQERHADKERKSQSFFLRGVEEGYFRADVDYNIVSRIGNASILYVMENQLYREFELQHIFRNIIVLFMRGFCTDKGLAIIEKL